MMPDRFSHALFALTTLMLTMAATGGRVLGQESGTWPQWRGPARDGRIEGQRWPMRLSEDNFQLLWRVEMGPSYSGPIVASDRVFVTETESETWEVVRALDRASGKQLWQQRWPGSLRVPFFASANGSWIRSTPALDGESLYVAGMRDVLVCLDAQTGQQQWRKDFVEEFGSPLPPFGFVSSPLVEGSHVYVQAGASIVQLDKRSGAVLWKLPTGGGGMNGSAFSSPVLAELAGVRQLVVQSREQMMGVDPGSGRRLWSHDIASFRGMNILTPTIYGDGVFTSSYGGATLLLKITANGGQLEPAVGWSTAAQGYMSSPIVHDGYVYLHLRNQRLACFDLSTGERQWVTQPFGKYWSMVAQGDRILALDERGELLLIAANPERFELIDIRPIAGAPTWAHLAACDDQIFVRELNAMTVYRWRDSVTEKVVTKE